MDAALQDRTISRSVYPVNELSVMDVCDEGAVYEVMGVYVLAEPVE